MAPDFSQRPLLQPCYQNLVTLTQYNLHLCKFFLGGFHILPATLFSWEGLSNSEVSTDPKGSANSSSVQAVSVRWHWVLWLGVSLLPDSTTMWLSQNRNKLANLMSRSLHWVFVVGYQGLKVYWRTEGQVEYTQNRLMRHVLALFDRVGWPQTGLKHLYAANVAWEAQELQLYMRSEINDIIKITEP